MELFDLEGRKINTLFDGSPVSTDLYGEKGNHEIRLNVENHAAGIYLLSVKTGETVVIKKVVIQ